MGGSGIKVENRQQLAAISQCPGTTIHIGGTPRRFDGTEARVLENPIKMVFHPGRKRKEIALDVELAADCRISPGPIDGPSREVESHHPGTLPGQGAHIMPGTTSGNQNISPNPFRPEIFKQRRSSRSLVPAVFSGIIPLLPIVRTGNGITHPALIPVSNGIRHGIFYPES